MHSHLIADPFYLALKGLNRTILNVDAIRLILGLYLEETPIEDIRRRLADIGVRKKNGTIISHGDILNIFTNEIYKGDKFLQKQASGNLITKRPDPNAEHESNYLTGDHEAIMEPAVRDAVQAKKFKKRLNTEMASPTFFIWEGFLRRVWRAHNTKGSQWGWRGEMQDLDLPLQAEKCWL